MTSKEKAEVLFEHIYQEMPNSNQEYELKATKIMSILFCDEMLENAGYIWGGQDTELGISSRDSFRKYWNEVKQEIEKL